MRDEQTQQVGWKPEHLSGGSAWAYLVLVLGVSLWAQLFSLPLLDEFQFTDHNALATMAYMVPLVALVPGALFRVPVLTLLVFPICFVPGVVLLPERSVIELEQGFSMLRIGVTMAAYVGVAAAGAARTQTVGHIDAADSDDAQSVDGIYPFYFVVRCVILIALLLITQYAAFYDPTIAAKIAESYADRPQAARTFIGLFSFFAWCVAAYTMFFVPLMNLEYDVRKLSRTISGMLEGGRRASLVRLSLWGLAASGVAAAAWALG
ncbi:hypothetical protein FIV42_03085 [Persicimonas caeni]|uniref:Uncharacterized protein n=1 Tax=Persicimonas caeni TaxID=2292766 RepID=A0A4Y6PPR5_PERCE|nr:hypothetical protein [Persicimonas caeni]QDG49755.1 hypothetical protein FIV42_03085 [Persicimonas caeni]QED30976.1 hypothetical protein FRD00_03080 [Persicimonas caeni]